MWCIQFKFLERWEGTFDYWGLVISRQAKEVLTPHKLQMVQILSFATRTHCIALAKRIEYPTLSRIYCFCFCSPFQWGFLIVELEWHRTLSLAAFVLHLIHVRQIVWQLSSKVQQFNQHEFRYHGKCFSFTR